MKPSDGVAWVFALVALFVWATLSIAIAQEHSIVVAPLSDPARP